MIGLDISEHNGYIDFDKLKREKSEIEFIIIRIGWIGNKNNHTQDTYFEDYYKRAKERGYKIGFYVYSYCRSVVAIDSACQWIEKKLQGKTMDMPLFLDMEDNSIVDCGKENLTRQCEYFCNYFEKRGIKTGIYANKNWFTNYLDINKLLNYKIWLAEWNDKITFNYKVDLWQYSSNFMFNNKRFDVNKCMCECTNPQPVEKIVDKKEVYVNMKVFINNTNYNSIVYCDSNCTRSIGTLNKGEKCDAIGIFENGKGERVVGVIYTIDKSNPVNRKIGYLKLINGEVK